MRSTTGVQWTSRTAMATVLLLMSLPVMAGSPHRIFVTSTSGTGDLSSWPEVAGQGLIGLDAGDGICRARAAAAGLDAPETFVAWLSDEQDDAFCRAHGLTGRRASQCGQPALPPAPGPWVRTDGYPFGPTLDRLLTPTREVYTPVGFDEFGTPVALAYFTATDGDGTRATDLGTCDNWTSTAPASAWGGFSTSTGSLWTRSTTPSCSQSRHLLCLQPMSGPPLAPFERPGRPAFVTASFSDGDLGGWPEITGQGLTGLDAGDGICQARAALAGLDQPETFKAWLSDSATDAVDRFEHDGPWVRLDGVPLADDLADLTDGTLFTALNLTDDGTYVGVGRVWTGTTAAGQRLDRTCLDWTNAGMNTGYYGFTGSTDSLWTETTIDRICPSSIERLYCFADRPFVDPMFFADGFESGDVSGWTSTMP